MTLAKKSSRPNSPTILGLCPYLALPLKCHDVAGVGRGTRKKDQIQTNLGTSKDPPNTDAGRHGVDIGTREMGIKFKNIRNIMEPARQLETRRIANSNQSQ